MGVSVVWMRVYPNGTRIRKPGEERAPDIEPANAAFLDGL
jgi:hypothetical protein